TQRGLISRDPPIVAGKAKNPAPPFQPTPPPPSPPSSREFFFFYLCAPAKRPPSVDADINCAPFSRAPASTNSTPRLRHMRDARDAAVDFVKQAFTSGQTIHGWQVDDVCREVIRSAGFGDYFIHRTGHSIHTEVHGNGANIDNLETRDDRILIPRTCFSIEP